MKTNHLDIVIKIIIIVCTVVVACVMCAIAFKLVNDGKSTVNVNTNRLNSMTGQYQDLDVSLYEGNLIFGNALVDLIKKAVDGKQYIAIEVSTLDGSTTSYNLIYNKEAKAVTETGSLGALPLMAVTENKGEMAYINPMALFMGKTFKNVSGNIVCVRFEQQP